MDRQEFEVALEVVMAAVKEQYILPLTLALGAMIEGFSTRERVLMAEKLREQAKNCHQADVAGGGLLDYLAEAALAPPPADPTYSEKAVRSVLRLVPKQDKNDVQDP